MKPSKEKGTGTSIQTPQPPQVIYPLEKPDSKKNKEASTKHSDSKQKTK